ncbi:MAG TPA: hypothetical protein VFA20_21090 [Myxococcaceae bacterium]|nr:hypothetical protein [Myxococcaceae bacterium]
MTVATATAQRTAQAATQSAAPQVFWSWLEYVNDHWSTAQMGQMPAMAAPLQNILWTMQKLKAASAKGDKAGLQSNVKDMLMRIDEGVKTGALSASDAQSLRRIANSFGSAGGGALSAKGQLGAVPAAAAKDAQRSFYALGDKDVQKYVEAFRNSPEGQALKPEVRAEVEQALTAAFDVPRKYPFGTEGTKKALAELDGHLAKLRGFAAKGYIRGKDLAPLQGLASRYRGIVNKAEEQARINAPIAAAREQAEKKALYTRAGAVLDTIQGIKDFRDSKNGWYSSGGYLGSAADTAIRSLEPLKSALAMPDDDPAKKQAVEAALATAQERLKAFPRGVDPAKLLHDEREENLNALSRAGDIAGLIPGPFGKALSFALKETEAGIRIASGEMSGAEFAAKTAGNLVSAAIPAEKIKGAGSFFSQALRNAAVNATKSFAADAARIWADDRLTPQQKADAYRHAFDGAMVDAYRTAIQETLGKLTGVLSAEEEKELADLAWKAAQKIGIDSFVQPEIKKLKDLPPR